MGPDTKLGSQGSLHVCIRLVFLSKCPADMWLMKGVRVVGGEGPLGGLELELGPASPKAWQGLLGGTVRNAQESRAPTSATPFIYHILGVPFTVLVTIGRFLISFQGGLGKGLYPNPNVCPASRTCWNVPEHLGTYWNTE